MKYSKEQLAQICINSKSYADVARALGLAPVGGTCCNLRDCIRKYGIDVVHFTGQAHRKGAVSNKKLPPNLRLVKRDPSKGRAQQGAVKKAYIELTGVVNCEICSQPPMWNNKRLVLHLDHIDGDFSNCIPTNLRLICPNCHSQTETYSKPKGA